MSGEFSVSLAYDVKHGDTFDKGDKDWKQVWKLKVPNRMRAVLCLMKHSNITNNVERERKLNP